MEWFQKHAPIRLKLALAFGSLTVLLTVVALGQLDHAQAGSAALASNDFAALRAFAADRMTPSYVSLVAVVVVAAAAGFVMRKHATHGRLRPDRAGARAARAGEPAILVLTTESSEEKRARARAAGATGWIVKPFDPDKLEAAILRTRSRQGCGSGRRNGWARRTSSERHRRQAGGQATIVASRNSLQIARHSVADRSSRAVDTSGRP